MNEGALNAVRAPRTPLCSYASALIRHGHERHEHASFHIRKHIPIGKGGMILTDDKDAYEWFRTVRYEGRTMSDDGINYVLYKDDTIKSQGWNMYMTPEQAARGLELIENIKDDYPDQESSGSCKDLSKLNLYDLET